MQLHSTSAECLITGMQKLWFLEQ